MNVDLKQESIHVSEIRSPQTLTLLVEGDMIVPDVNPDIKEVLLAEAGAVITGREYNDARLTVSGHTPVKILYMPEEGGEPKTMDAKFDFKDVLELASEENLMVGVWSRCEHVDFSLINSRKLHIKVVISVVVKSYAGRDLNYPMDVATPEEIKVRKRSMSAYRVLADTNREFLISESLEVPAGKPDINALIRPEVYVRKDECRVMSGKILLKGSLMMNALYWSEEGTIERMEYEIPFSEMVDVDGLEDSAVCHVRYSVKDVFCSVKEDMNGDFRVILADVVLMADIMSGTTEEFEIIDDCYSTQGEVVLHKERAVLDELLS
ncbi:MAG: DUF3794 domain-containing protein, partial [Clostridia bacterium]|nr:DUF3794 domain-containing protein [Clostridia bacterium]